MLIEIGEAAKRIAAGEVIAVPTDTVYGLAARYDDFSAIERVFSMKGRPLGRALTLLGCDPSVFRSWVKKLFLSRFDIVAKEFWPGALTLVVPVVERVRREKSTIGFRIPAHTALLQLLERVGPLVNPSANKTGELPAQSVEDLEHLFGERFPILRGPLGDEREASTVVELLPNDEWIVLREGPIVHAEIATAFAG